MAEARYRSADPNDVLHTSKGCSQNGETGNERTLGFAVGQNRTPCGHSFRGSHNRAGWSRWKMDRGHSESYSGPRDSLQDIQCPAIELQTQRYGRVRFSNRLPSHTTHATPRNIWPAGGAPQSPRSTVPAPAEIQSLVSRPRSPRDAAARTA